MKTTVSKYFCHFRILSYRLHITLLRFIRAEKKERRGEGLNVWGGKKNFNLIHMPTAVV